MNEESWFKAGVGIAEALEDFGPTLNTIGVGLAQADAEAFVVRGDGAAVALTAVDIASGEQGVDPPGIGRVMTDSDARRFAEFL